MLHNIFKLAVGIIFAVLLANSAIAQTNGWSTQGASGCSDQFGSFDAFIPGMRGPGSCNRGGFVPGTTVHVVTNTNATGAGSFEEAAKASCPKVILFGVSGLINRGGSSVMNRCNNWSVVGASAPGNIVLTGAMGNPLLETRGSYFTIDHLTLAAGDEGIQSGGTGNRDSIGFEAATAQTTGTIINNNFIWGADETVQCYASAIQSNILYWQNIMGIPLGGSGVHIIQDTCTFNASIRNFYVHSTGRHPLVRADAYFHANNFTANPGYETIDIKPCQGTYLASASKRMSIENNFMVRGPNSNNQAMVRLYDGSACTNFLLYENGNATMNNDNTIQNCANHACTQDVPADELTSAPIVAIYPKGYVPESISQNAEGLLNFANKITAYAGARPTARLPYVQTKVDQAINMVDGTGDEGGAPPFTVQATFTSAGEGGITAITPQSIAKYDPTAAADNPCGEDMPSGSTADAIQSSGLTRLHEWVIGCFYDNLMPAAYREDKLQNYGAPGGGGLGAPPPPAGLPSRVAPNPPADLHKLPPV